MILNILSWISWLLGANPLDRVLRGLVGACGISVLNHVMRIQLFIETYSVPEEDHKKKSYVDGRGWAAGRFAAAVRFLGLTGLLSVVGQRVASLIVLEFSLRAILAAVTTRQGVLSGSIRQLLVQCQFSLGCAFSCSLDFLQEGALHNTLNLLLAGGLSWFIADHSQRLWSHVVGLYPQHGSQHCCGICLSLSTHNNALLPFINRAVLLAFAMGTVASLSIVNHHYASDTDSVRFWTPLVICYTMLMVYIQEGQQRRPDGEAVLHTVVLRLGALLVLTLSVGWWVDVLHILMALLGELICLLPCQDLLYTQPVSQEEEETSFKTS
ncbi:transmembrane protein 82 isoform X1 [Chanos chanos]|uniref:Transmembrane protein 82 isoform X1 n=1 Tax=Chanos chanos TaxID=29144 RepID=A0A6J2VN58_CHACN|nr:transmembrane protein 82-like isoform X1 [Chanos chanos]